MNSLRKFAAPLVLAALGMLGLYFHVEYAGWVLFVALFWIFSE